MTQPTRGFISWLLIIGIAIALLIGGGYYVLKMNRAEITNLEWSIQQANPTVTDPDDNKKYEQKIGVDVTYSDQTTKHYEVGSGYGCVNTGARAVDSGAIRLECNFADSSTVFVAHLENGKLVVEREVESAKDGSIQTTVLLTI